MTRILLALILVPLAMGVTCAQQDTLRLSVGDAERLFQQRNLLLLAAHYNVEVARAAGLQASLWNNPTIGIEQNVHNPSTHRWFDMTSTGNTGFQIQQLLHLAGQRSKMVAVAEGGTEIARESLADALRTLRTTVRTTCYDLSFQLRALAFYDEKIASVSQTVHMMENVYEHRSILLSEVLRIKALLFSLQTERLALLSKIEGSEATLKVLLADTSSTVLVPVMDRSALDVVRPDSLHYEELLEIATARRPDLLKASQTVRQDQANLSYQRSLAVPDLTVGGLWSRSGSYIPNYTALTVSIDLPLFNRNQGGIEAAERAADADSASATNLRLQVAREVHSAYQHAVEADRLYRTFDRTFTVQFQTLVESTIANFEKRNMSTVEFADFMESYRTSTLQGYQLENDRLDALEGLNCAVGIDLFTR